ncbi:putative phage infection protein [Bifidobacterium saguini DSM 23967]|uniref:YhgE/Pip domain-containing protein n=2 Tax=Bifidobacterium saguini TaxID=762210 RepID=A0ABX7SGD0_9BIFI|nr:putative phage infection protein [Bifidobacterium saguini DSM 23967]QTB91797.1 YhgE/Pip domain-containing protein [Bifidobacterium saguini]
MGNILKVLKRDFMRLFRVPTSWVILIGMVFIPPLYSWYNIIGFWNPYGNTKGITVAVANNDAGTDNALIGKQNLGGQIVKQMKNNDQLGWTFVSEAEAMDMVQSGKAYAAIVIPKNFSDSLAGVVTGGESTPTLEYYVNEKASAIAPKVTDVGASTVDRTVNSTFVSTVSKVLTETINKVGDKALATGDKTKSKTVTSLNEASSDVQRTRDTIAKLQTKLDDAPNKTRTARQALEDARKLGIDAAEGLAGTSKLIGTAQNSMNSFVTSTSGALDEGSSLLSQAAAQANQNIGTVTGAINAANQQVGGMINTAEDINQANADILATLKELPGANQEPLKSAIDQLEKRNSQLGNTLGNLNSLNTTIGSASKNTAGLANNLNTTTQTTLQATNEARSTLVSGSLPQLNNGLNTLSTTATTLSNDITSQDSLISQSKDALDQLDKAAASTKTALTDTDKALATVQTKLSTLATDIKAMSISTSLGSLIDSDGSLDASKIADFMMSPTVINEKTIYPVSSYGSGMAPLFTTLALWVGAFVLVVIPKLETDNEGIEDLTPTQGYLGRFFLLATLASAQGLVTGIGDLVLGMQCASIPVFLLTCWITSLVYMSFIFALSTTFMHVGKGVCVALVILQVPGASGLYPIEMMPKFFRVIYPLLPFTYSIDAMRETIGGFYDGHWFGYIGKLLIFAVLAFLLGLVARPKLANLNRLFAREIEESDMILGEPVHIEASEYKVTQAISALANRTEYKHAIERRAAKFTQQYPKLLFGALIAGFVVPAILIIVFSLTTSEKIVVMATWLAWVLIIIGFLMVVEYMRDSIRRQTELGNLSDESIRSMLYGRHAESSTGSSDAPTTRLPSLAGKNLSELTNIPNLHGIAQNKEGKHAR